MPPTFSPYSEIQREPKLPLETASYPKDLVTSNPAASDGMNNADDHMRMIKACLKNALAGVTGALTRAVGASSFALQPPAGTSTNPAYAFSEETTLGFYRSASGVISVAGGRLITSPVGGLHQFLVEPVGLGKGGTGTGHEYLELDGSTWNTADFPRLAEHLGAEGLTFTLPDAKTAGRFLRSRTASVTAGTTQADTVGPHTHPDVTKTTGNNSVDHTHPFSGTTASMNQNASHYHGVSGLFQVSGGSVGGGGSFGRDTSGNTNATNTDHQHAFSGNTTGQSANHTHDVTVNTPANTGTTETRPVNLSVVFCIKT